ncbi:MAG: response regulator transcription factor, partial [Spirochaetales bacterium]|nr:response regulator transcription factor [Spirochaetales bacterium]
KYGAVDYIEKPFSVAVLKEKIKSLIRDHEVYSETEIEKMEKKLLRSIRTKESTETHFELLSKRFDLSSREQEIIQYIIRGMDNKDIAEKLFISIDTVKSHFQKIKIKCKVKNKIQLANLFRL